MHKLPIFNLMWALPLLLLLLLAVFAVSTGADDNTVSSDSQDVEYRNIARSLVSMGDTARLQWAMVKARAGGQVVVGTIGGSITHGASASAPDKNWSSLVAQWWRTKFPQAQVRLVNAGIGGTGSLTGSFRAYDHLLKEKPDFVVAEYAVNDADSGQCAETLEGIVRQTLSQPNKPAVMLLFLTRPDGASAQQWHSKVGYHYGLPMVSFRDVFVPEYESGRLNSTDIQPDGLHPNDRGHKACAAFITAVLDKAYDKLPADGKLPKIKQMPAPLISDVFQYASMFNAESITPAMNKGWNPAEATVFGKCWETSAPGSYMEFEVTGTVIAITYLRTKDMGTVVAQVDDLAPVNLDANFIVYWGGYHHCEVLAKGLKYGSHKVRIRLLNRKAADSNGRRFQLASVMVAGR